LFAWLSNCLERGERDLRLLGEPFFRNRFRNMGRDALERLRVELGRVEHVLRALDAWEHRAGKLRIGLLLQRFLHPVDDEIIVVLARGTAINAVRIGDLLQRGEVRDSRHRDEVARVRVISKGEERQRAARPFARRDQRRERGIRQAVELAGGHVARAGRVVVHRIVHAIEHEQFAAELRVELFIAHPAGFVRTGRRKLVGAPGEDVAFLVEPVDFASSLGIHQIRGVPTTRRVEHDVVGAFVRIARLRTDRVGKPERGGYPYAGEAAELQEITPGVEVLTHRGNRVGAAGR
jgi:hypothetical protein